MVSIVRYDGTHKSIARAVELCGGLNALKADQRVLIKPNGVGSDPAIPYFGMMTSAVAVEGIVRMLLDFGCAPGNITIGEGAASSRELGMNTMTFLRAMGLGVIAKKYRVKLLDFNEAPKRIVEADGCEYEIAEAALNAEFLINVPVPKYHEQTVVSLSLKNLKGCLSPESKKRCHDVRLEDHIARFNTLIPCHLTIMDGIYFLRDGGPFIDSGAPCRKNMIMAGTDRLEIDSAGCRIVAVDPVQVRHIAKYAELTGRTGEIGKVDWAGDTPDGFFEDEFTGGREIFFNSFRNSGVKGLKMQHPGQTWCTGCNISLRGSVYLLCKDNGGRDFGGIEIIAGKQTRATGEYPRTILFGDCPIKTNKSNTKIGDRLEIPGCPPSFMKAYPAVLKFALPPRDARRQLVKNLTLGALTRMGVCRIQFPFLSGLPEDVFEPRHFGHR